MIGLVSMLHEIVVQQEKVILGENLKREKEKERTLRPLPDF